MIKSIRYTLCFWSYYFYSKCQSSNVPYMWTPRPLSINRLVHKWHTVKCASRSTCWGISGRIICHIKFIIENLPFGNIVLDVGVTKVTWSPTKAILDFLHHKCAKAFFHLCDIIQTNFNLIYWDNVKMWWRGYLRY